MRAVVVASLLWAYLVKWLSGSTDTTSVPIVMMGPHMQVSASRPAQPGDAARAAAIVDAAKHVLAHYQDVRTAQADGYKMFAPNVIVPEEHFTSVRYSSAERNGVDYLHPGSLLYRRVGDGFKIVGVMYGAPGKADAATLDKIAPLSYARWHRHVDFCVADRAGASDPRFGFGGSIHAADACKAAGGFFIPLAFGWMTHVYPNETPDKVWGGEEMSPAKLGSMSTMH